MIERASGRVAALVLALALPHPAAAQTLEAPVVPSAAATAKLIHDSNGYVKLLVSALRWKTPATEACKVMEQRVGFDATAMDDLGDPRRSASHAAMVEMFQRTEENTMARHANLSRVIHEAIQQDCLILD